MEGRNVVACCFRGRDAGAVLDAAGPVVGVVRRCGDGGGGGAGEGREEGAGLRGVDAARALTAGGDKVCAFVLG